MAEIERSPREIVLAFYETSFNEKNAEKAAEFLGDRYLQHNPSVVDGADALLRFVRFRRERFPQAHNEVKMVIAEGDLVVLYVHVVLVPGTPGRRIIDIFRVEDDKVVEHWDVVQDIPEQLYPPMNDNGLF
jgi:predicted SnoaL-like aldol condensation-catalyzing enzyme